MFLNFGEYFPYFKTHGKRLWMVPQLWGWGDLKYVLPGSVAEWHSALPSKPDVVGSNPAETGRIFRVSIK